jgi:hypothetical protein
VRVANEKYIGFKCNKKTRHNNVVKTPIQQSFYSTNSPLSHKSINDPPLKGEQESASLLSNNNPPSFAPTQEFMSNDNDNQKELIKSKVQADNKFEQDWSRSFFGLSTKAFPQEAADILLAPINIDDIECKPGKIQRTLLLKFNI